MELTVRRLIEILHDLPPAVGSMEVHVNMNTAGHDGERTERTGPATDDVAVYNGRLWIFASDRSCGEG